MRMTRRWTFSPGWLSPPGPTITRISFVFPPSGSSARTVAGSAARTPTAGMRQRARDFIFRFWILGLWLLESDGHHALFRPRDTPLQGSLRAGILPRDGVDVRIAETPCS